MKPPVLFVLICMILNCASSFAGEPLLVGIEGLVEDGLLPREVLTGVPASLGRGSTRYADAAAIKYPLFVRAWQSFKARGGLKADPWKRFVRRNRYWLPGWRAFTKDSSGLHAFLQFQFARQWSRLRAAADSRGIRLLGDVPIFVAHGSADVRDHPELFRLAQNGDPNAGLRAGLAALQQQNAAVAQRGLGAGYSGMNPTGAGQYANRIANGGHHG